jgi:NAD(P)-dependent dehydrogenase (short-subunit alcohol dehydrogenase family)
MPTLNERVALVTGAARRTGKAIAVALAQAGADVVVHYRSSRVEAEATAAEIRDLGVRSVAAGADLGVPEDVDSLFEAIRNQWGRLDVLVNNASHLRFQHVLELSHKEWQQGLDPLTGVFLCCQRALPMMLEQDYGRIVNITDSSAERLYAAPTATPYRIGKTGILILTKTFAECATGDNVTVNALAPGTIFDSQTKPAPDSIPAGRYAGYDDIINAIMFLVDPASSYISGAGIKVSGGWDV